MCEDGTEARSHPQSTRYLRTSLLYAPAVAGSSLDQLPSLHLSMTTPASHRNGKNLISSSQQTELLQPSPYQGAGSTSMPRVRQGTPGIVRCEASSVSSDDASDAGSDSLDAEPDVRASSAPRFARPTSGPDATHRKAIVTHTFPDRTARAPSTDDESDDNVGAIIYGTTDPDEDGYVMQSITIIGGRAAYERYRNGSRSGSALTDSIGSAKAAPSAGGKKGERAAKAKPLARIRELFAAMRVSDTAHSLKPIPFPADDAPMSRASLVAYSKADVKVEKRRLKEERKREAALLALRPEASDFASKRSAVAGVHTSSATNQVRSGKSGTGKTGE